MANDRTAKISNRRPLRLIDTPSIPTTPGRGSADREGYRVSS
jgi:hypothetical protein